MPSSSPLIRGYEVVIGLETHAQLSTASKIFSGASTTFGAAPNTQACAVDLALPGTLPVMNRGAVERAIRLGLAVGAKVAPLSIFARKNYFYPDLPKGYQISQYEVPVVQGGRIDFMLAGAKKSVRLTRAHLEEDAGKSLHEDFAGQTGIDLNRAGTPLLEIVSEPDMRSSAEAVEYAKALHALVVWLGICDGNMQEGSFRCDANVSVRRPGAAYGTRREIKNLNSFRNMAQAIDFEVQWQIDRVEDGLAIEQATVLFNPDSGETRAMRSKEDAHDYRYFPDPDLPPLLIAPDWIERVKQEMPELPTAMAKRFAASYGLAEADAELLTSSRAKAAYFEELVGALQSANPAIWPNAFSADGAGWYGRAAAIAINQLIAASLNRDGLAIADAPVKPAVLSVLMSRQIANIIGANAMRQVFDELWAGSTADVDAVIAAKGLKLMDDSAALQAIVDQVIAGNAKSVDEFRAGKDKAFNALVGQVMKASLGKANPVQAGELLRRRLAG